MNNELTPLQQLGQAVCAGDLSTARTVAKEHPELMVAKRLNKLLRAAARNNRVEAMAYLVECGANIDSPRDEDVVEGCIDEAASNGAVEAVRWLIEKGAKINYEVDGVVRCISLSGAVLGGHFEIVKLLVENGADVNAVWKEKNGLVFSVMYGRKEVEAYLRSHGAVDPSGFSREPDIAPAIAGPEAAWNAHIAEHLGPPEPLSLQQIVPGDPSIAIHVVPMNGGKALVTRGMSSRAMVVPVGSESLQFAELVMYLPSHWPLDESALGSPNYRWPVEWLLKIARYPHAHRTWLGGKAVVFANDEPPRPLAPNTQLSCMLAMTEASDFGRMQRSDGSEVVFYTLIPLYTEERDLEKRKGTVALVERFEAHGVDRVVDVKRPNVAK